MKKNGISDAEIAFASLLRLNTSDYRPFINAGVEGAQATIAQTLPDMKLKGPVLEQSIFEDRTNWLADQMSQSMRDSLDKAITDGINAGNTYGVIGDNIQQMLGINPNDAKEVGWRADRVARTESMWATNEAALQQYEAIGVSTVDMLTAIDACDDCNAAASENPYQIQEAADWLPIHPNCRCVWSTDFSEFTKADIEQIRKNVNIQKNWVTLAGGRRVDIQEKGEEKILGTITDSGGNKIHIIQNPAPSVAEKFTHEGDDALRGFVTKDGNFAAWDAYFGLHAEIADQMPQFKDAIAVEIWSDGVVNLTDFNTNLHEAARVIATNSKVQARLENYIPEKTSLTLDQWNSDVVGNKVGEIFNRFAGKKKSLQKYYYRDASGQLRYVPERDVSGRGNKGAVLANHTIDKDEVITFNDPELQKYHETLQEKADNWVYQATNSNKSALLTRYSTRKGQEILKVQVHQLKNLYPENVTNDGNLTLYRGGNIPSSGVYSYAVSKSVAEGYATYKYGSPSYIPVGPLSAVAPHEIVVNPSNVLAVINGEEILVDSSNIITRKSLLSKKDEEDTDNFAIYLHQRYKEKLQKYYYRDPGGNLRYVPGVGNVGTKAEAAAFVKNSAIKETLYHGVSDTGKEGILQDGFRPDPEGEYGKAVYFTISPQAATDYGTNVIPAKINVKNIKTISSFQDLVDESNTEGVALDSYRDYIARTYDALVVKEPGYVAVFDDPKGHIAVFDPKNTMVITSGSEKSLQKNWVTLHDGRKIDIGENEAEKTMIAKLGTTTNLNKAGFMTTDGKLIPKSSGKDVNGKEYKVSHLATLNNVFPEKYTEASAVQDYLNDSHNLRLNAAVSPSSSGTAEVLAVETVKQPTVMQLTAIKEMVTPKTQISYDLFGGKDYSSLLHSFTVVGYPDFVEKINEYTWPKKSLSKNWVTLEDGRRIDIGDKLSDIGRRYNTDQVWAARAKGHEFEKLSSGGSGRDVYVVSDGAVVKVAKSPLGLRQNDSEGDYVVADHMPKVLEKGLDYVVAERAMKDVPAINQFLKPLQQFTVDDFDAKTPALQEAMRNMGIDNFMNYDLLWNDFKATRNWGTIEGTPVLVDAGALDRTIHFGATPDTSTLQDWQHILSARRSARKNRESANELLQKYYYRDKEGRLRFVPGDGEGTATTGGGKTLSKPTLQNMKQNISLQLAAQSNVPNSGIPASIQDDVNNIDLSEARTPQEAGQIILDKLPMGIGQFPEVRDTVLHHAENFRVMTQFSENPDAVPVTDLGRNAFNWTKYDNADQATVNTNVTSWWNEQFPSEKGFTDNFDWQKTNMPLSQLHVGVAFSAEKATEYAHKMKEGTTFPPLLAVKLAPETVLLDGAHRVEALKINNVTDVAVLLGTAKKYE